MVPARARLGSYHLNWLRRSRSRLPAPSREIPAVPRKALRRRGPRSSRANRFPAGWSKAPCRRGCLPPRTEDPSRCDRSPGRRHRRHRHRRQSPPRTPDLSPPIRNLHPRPSPNARWMYQSPIRSCRNSSMARQTVTSRQTASPWKRCRYRCRRALLRVRTRSISPHRRRERRPARPRARCAASRSPRRWVRSGSTGYRCRRRVERSGRWLQLCWDSSACGDGPWSELRPGDAVHEPMSLSHHSRPIKGVGLAATHFRGDDSNSTPTLASSKI